MGDTHEQAVSSFGARPTPGARWQRRGQPRVAITAAAAGGFVVFSGAMSLAFDATSSDSGGEVSNTPGTLISLAVVVAGYVLLAIQKRGPLATAGVVAFAVALPFLAFFATLDENDFPPFSIDAILGISTLGWGLAYAVGPSRGHPFLLGGALLGAWWFVLEQVTDLFSAPFNFIEGLFSSFAPSDEVFEGASSFAGPDASEVAGVCGCFAVAYLVISHFLERRGIHGVATPMVAIGHAAAIVGILAISGDLEEIGTGILAIVVGLLLLYRGAASERRATTWIGGIYLVAGVQSIVTGVTDSATTGGGILIGAGLVVTVLAALFANVTDEPGDDEPGPSFPTGLRRRPALATAGTAPTAPPTTPPAAGPPAEGWWIASDGQWYPPEQHPDARGDA